MTTPRMHAQAAATAAPKSDRPRRAWPRQTRALLWQEWRQARAVLLIAAALPVLGFSGVLVWRADELLPVAWFYTIMSGMLVGVGVGGVDPRNVEFLRAKPMPFGQVWRVKCMLGLVAAAVVGAMSFLLTHLACRLADGADRASIWLAWACLAAFLPAFYSAGWAKSIIVAMGAAGASGFAIAACWRYVPFQYYLSPRSTWAAGAVLLLLFAPMSRLCFVWRLRCGGGMKKRHALGWFALPVVTLGVLPYAADIAWVKVDEACLDPTDFSFMKVAGFSSPRRDVWLSVQPARKFCHGVAYQDLPLDSFRTLRVSLDKSAMRRTAMVWMPLSGKPSPSRRRLVVMTLPVANWRRDDLSDFRPGLTVYDAETDQSQEVAGAVGWRTQTYWLNGDRLLFAWVRQSIRQDDRCILHWGQWRPGQAAAEVHSVSFGGTGNSCCVVGLRSDPLEAVIVKWSRPAMFWNVCLDTGTTRRYVAPDHTELKGVYPKAGIAVLEQGSHSPTEPFSKHQPLIMNLVTGSHQTVDDFVGARLPWRRTKPSAWLTPVWLTQDERWMIIQPTEADTSNEPGWFVFDLEKRRLYRQPPPEPRGAWRYQSDPGDAYVACTISLHGGLVYAGSCLLVFDPRNSDPAARLIIDAGASADVVDFQWISDHEIVLCVRDEGHGLRSSTVPGGLKFRGVRSGVCLADIDAMSVRPVWPKEGLGLKVSITTWPDWQRRNP